MNVAFTSRSPPALAYVQMWFARTPYVQPFSCLSRTAVGPRPMLPAEAVVGRGRPEEDRADAQIHPPEVGSLGEKKKLCTVSPRPNLLSIAVR